ASGYGVLGVANADQSTGVRGNSTNGTGVGGNSSLGMAVHGNSTNGTGVFGQSLGSGTALKGQSANGFGLDVSGKVKISGGNTSPATGAVLTSIDVSGNAVWKPQQIAFKAFGTHSSFITVPMSSASRKMHFASEQYDYGNNFVPTTSGSPSAEMSTFIAPISGLYHFDVGINVTLDDTYDDFRDVNAYVIVKRNNVDFTILTISTQCCNANLGYQVSLYGSIDQKLLPGDAVRVQIYQWNDDDATAKQPNTIDNYFSGHLVFAD
ncbi:MAG TPA: hypothetical protein PKD90_15335, partial [Phnomibacter sp.]|nr:hypothetical protein [Phnomibacter sp.]